MCAWYGGDRWALPTFAKPRQGPRPAMGGQATKMLAGALCLRVHPTYQELEAPQCAHPGGGPFSAISNRLPVNGTRAVLVANPNGSAWRMSALLQIARLISRARIL